MPVVRSKLTRRGTRQGRHEGVWAIPGNIELLKKLHAEGLYYSLIAMRIGHGCTRSAAIGKAKRLKLPERGVDRGLRQRNAARARKNSGWVVHRQARAARREKRGADLTRGPELGELRVLPGEPQSKRLALTELEAKHCRWPSSEAHPRDVRYCGLDRVMGKPYCEHHLMRSIDLAYRRRRDRTPAEDDRQVAVTPLLQIA